MNESEIEKNIINNKMKCYEANGESVFCGHGECVFNSKPCAKLEEILRGN